MLALQEGRAMRYLTRSLQELGFRWAYRVVETRAFGLPQRRQRVILVASREEDPRTVLFAEDAGAVHESRRRPDSSVACGFYWTEGIRGLGWGVNCVPTLKGGSTIGIPSPPAIWSPDGLIGTPDIRDAERLQGFPVGWTAPAQERVGARNARWKLVGNAVSVPVARWLGRRLVRPGEYRSRGCLPLRPSGTWPDAAWSDGRAVFVEQASSWPVRRTITPLREFLRYPLRPLSARATSGFLDRTRRSSLRFEPGFLDAVRAHGDRVAEASVTG
jgi:DNA (cytosine-5)-methyltransferase 1